MPDPRHDDTRNAFLARLADDLARGGVESIDRPALARDLAAQGVGRTAAYRWIAEAVAADAERRARAEAISDAAAARAERTSEPAADAAREIVAKLPKVVRIDDVASAGQIPVIERLNQCLQIADMLVKHAQTDDGRVKNAKLLLQSSEHLRRCLETATRIAEVMRQVGEVDRFHAAIIEKISARDPVLAEELLRDLTELSAAWAVAA
jgi:aminopeptidase N